MRLIAINFCTALKNSPFEVGLLFQVNGFDHLLMYSLGEVCTMETDI